MIPQCDIQFGKRRIAIMRAAPAKLLIAQGPLMQQVLDQATPGASDPAESEGYLQVYKISLLYRYLGCNMQASPGQATGVYTQRLP